MIETVIIGSGNVASAIARAMKENGTPPKQIFSRNEQAGREIAAVCGCVHTSDPAVLAKAGLYIIAVTDKAIASVSGSLDFGEAVVAHTAGSVSIDVLSDRIAHKAVLYPLQTFTKGREMDFSTVPLLTEYSDDRAKEVISGFASSLSDDVREMDSKRRAMVHIAAVFACNFTNYMYTVGESLAREAGADFSLLKPLILETAAKAAGAASPVDVQTGPAVRNDFQTKSMHCEMLFEKPDLKNIYINLSNNIWETSKKISQK